MSFLSVVSIIVGIANKVTKNKRIVIGHGNKIIIDLDRLPKGDPGHDEIVTNPNPEP